MEVIEINCENKNMMILNGINIGISKIELNKSDYDSETLWMTQKAMSELFDVEQPAIAKDPINIYNEKN